jgi:hypothetical protein
VELATRAIEYSSLPGENVLDLFGGSGSTLIAAEQTGRKAFLMGVANLDTPRPSPPLYKAVNGSVRGTEHGAEAGYPRGF